MSLVAGGACLNCCLMPRRFIPASWRQLGVNPKEDQEQYQQYRGVCMGALELFEEIWHNQQHQDDENRQIPACKHPLHHIQPGFIVTKDFLFSLHL